MLLEMSNLAQDGQFSCCDSGMLETVEHEVIILSVVARA